MRKDLVEVGLVNYAAKVEAEQRLHYVGNFDKQISAEVEEARLLKEIARVAGKATAVINSINNNDGKRIAALFIQDFIETKG